MSSVARTFYAKFLASGVAATGLTVTVNVYRRLKASPYTKSTVTTGGSATEDQDGVYSYSVAGIDFRTYDYVTTFTTSGTADQKSVTSLWTEFSPAGEVALPDAASTAATGVRDVARLNGSSNAALYWQKMLDSTIFPTATATGTSTSRSFTLDSALANASADMMGGILWKVSGKPFVRRITSYTASTPAVVAWNEPVTGQPALDGSEVYVIIPATEVDRGTDARVLLSANAQTGVTIPAVTTLTNDPTGTTTLLSRLTGTRATNLDNLDAAVSSRHSAAQQTTDLSSILAAVGNVPGLVWAYSSRTLTAISQLAGITSLAQWLGLLANKQAGNATARTELRATGAGAGTFDETTDSQEAIVDRGNAAWTTGSDGGDGTTMNEVTNITYEETDVR